MSDVPLRLAFAGTPDLAATILQSLLANGQYRICLVFTQPDRPAGRGRKVKKSAVKILAEQHQLPIREPLRSTDFDHLKELATINVLVVAAYGMILPAEVLERPVLGCVNVHTSLLPRWRGAAPIQRAILAGDRETGITIMKMEAGLDSGDILLQRTCTIHPSDTAATLEERLANLGSKCLHEVLDQVTRGDINPSKQDDRYATYAAKITKQEACINWARPAAELERIVRAFNPHPVAFTELNGTVLRIWQADIVTDTALTAPPGTVVAADKNGILVTTGEQLLRLREVQVPGKKVVSAGDFINGHPDFFTRS